MSEPGSKREEPVPAARWREISSLSSRALTAFDAGTEPTAADEEFAWRRLREQLRQGDAPPKRSRPAQRWLFAAAALAGLTAALVVGVGTRRQGTPARTVVATAKVDDPRTVATPAPTVATPSVATPAVQTVPPPIGDGIARRSLPFERVRLDPHITVTARAGTYAATWIDRAGGRHIDLTSGTVELVVSGSVHPTLVVDAGDYHLRDRGTIFEVGRSGAAVWLHVKAGAVAVSKDRRTLAVIRAQHRWSSDATEDGAAMRTRSIAVAPTAPASNAPSAAEEAPPPPPEAPPPSAPAPAAPASRPALSDCRALEQQQREGETQTCLRTLANGTDLSAETALYELARFQRERLGDTTGALATLQKQRRLFPSGALLDEAELTTIELLPRAGRYRSALDLSDAFLARHPRHERAAELHLLRANILREVFTDYAAAVHEYEEVDSAAGKVADDAAFYLAVTLEADGRRDDASDAYRRYLKRASPAHASVARARLTALGR